MLSLPKLCIIAGPTASGKTAFAIKKAQQINGEIISADSMQVYKHMNIGTAKPTVEEMEGVPHHLLDVAMPSQNFSVADYTALANIAIQDILSRGKTPILAGGTGFYINAIIRGTSFEPGQNNEHQQEALLREEYTKLAQEQGAEVVHQKLQELDPKYASLVHPNNIKKVARAISFCLTTGKLFSKHNEQQRAEVAKYDLDFFVLNMDREALYSRINSRVLTMWDMGLTKEVEWLLAQGFGKTLPAM